ncbi:hypothetical protein [Ostreiculturibacter nitratireducens]|uniref:hypothetical protein n=1 Tax=Ostreiculturibacter nitratireducens TaxID=3075226 RepID=UPI0031B618B6
MTIRFSAGEAPARTFVEETDELFRDAAEELMAAIREIRSGKLEEVKAVNLILRDLRAAFRQALDERKKIEELRKQGDGAGGGGALDFDAARAEIGRRLACLRDAGNG